MTTESEQCVDNLLNMMSELDHLSQSIQLGQTEELVQESRKILSKTQLFIDNHHSVIPPYILKKVTDSFKKLEKQANSHNKLKMKFKFKSQPSQTKPETENKMSIEESNPKPLKKYDLETDTSNTFFGFRDKINEELYLDSKQVDSKDVSLINLKGCKVKIIGLANTVYIRNLENTSVTLFLTRRAISIINCSDCRFNLVCQQLRIDSTKDSLFKIFTSARSMLESSSGLEIEELTIDKLALDENLERDVLSDYMKTANFIENNWKCIDDFDWLSPTTASINFKICS